MVTVYMLRGESTSSTINVIVDGIASGVSFIIWSLISGNGRNESGRTSSVSSRLQSSHADRWNLSCLLAV